MKQRKSTELLILTAYIENQPAGATLYYDQIEHDTGIVMDDDGRTKLRHAMEDAKREYKNIRSQGYILDSVELVTEIMSIHVKRIFSRVKRTQQAHRVLKPRYYPLMPKQERDLLDLQGVVLDTMAEAGERQKKFYEPKRKQLAQTTETVPLPKEWYE